MVVRVQPFLYTPSIFRMIRSAHCTVEATVDSNPRAGLRIEKIVGGVQVTRTMIPGLQKFFKNAIFFPSLNANYVIENVGYRIIYSQFRHGSGQSRLLFPVVERILMERQECIRPTGPRVVQGASRIDWRKRDSVLMRLKNGVGVQRNYYVGALPVHPRTKQLLDALLGYPKEHLSV